MANLNKVMLIGRLTRNPELRYTPSGLPVTDFGLAVNRYRKAQDGSRVEEVTFVDVTAFARTAELISQYLKQGKQAFIDGHLRYETWNDRNTGQKRSRLSVVAENVQFLDRAEGGGPPPDMAGGESEFRATGGGGGDYAPGSAPPADYSQPPPADYSQPPPAEDFGHRPAGGDREEPPF